MSALLLVFAVQSHAASQPSVLQAKTVRANALEIVDASGKLRIALSTLGPFGNIGSVAFVQMNDAAGNATLGLQAADHNSWIDLRAPGGKTVIRLTNGLEFPSPQPQIEIHGGGITFYDPWGRERMDLNTSTQDAGIDLLDGTGQIGIGLDVWESIGMHAGILMGPPQDQASGISVESPDHQILFRAP